MLGHPADTCGATQRTYLNRHTVVVHRTSKGVADSPVYNLKDALGCSRLARAHTHTHTDTQCGVTMFKRSYEVQPTDT